MCALMINYLFFCIYDDFDKTYLATTPSLLDYNTIYKIKLTFNIKFLDAFSY